jgi:hypothetical protein
VLDDVGQCLLDDPVHGSPQNGRPCARIGIRLQVHRHARGLYLRRQGGKTWQARHRRQPPAFRQVSNNSPTTVRTGLIIRPPPYRYQRSLGSIRVHCRARCVPVDTADTGNFRALTGTLPIYHRSASPQVIYEHQS